jgi:hypothetical protein
VQYVIKIKNTSIAPTFSYGECVMHAAYPQKYMYVFIYLFFFHDTCVIANQRASHEALIDVRWHSWMRTPTSCDFYYMRARSALAMHMHKALKFYVRVHGGRVYVCTHILYSMENIYCMKFESFNTSTVVFNLVEKKTEDQ